MNCQRTCLVLLFSYQLPLFHAHNSQMPSSISISSSTFFFFFSMISISPSLILTASVVEDLNNLQPPPDFNSTIIRNCLNNPSLRYCNSSSPLDLVEVFKSTIVASHLCNESRNPNCVDTFPKVDLHSRPKIAPLYLSFSFFWKYCPLTILSIDLSNNSIQGGFPSDVLRCSQIQALDLSHNELSGDVPVQSFSPLTNLTLLNLSYNHFTESKISDSQFFKRFDPSSFLHSGLLPDHQRLKIKAVLVLFGFPMFVILIVGCLGWMCLRHPDFLPTLLRGKHKFTPAMIKSATGGFSRNDLVGKSEGIEIYRGKLRGSGQVRIEIYRDEMSGEGRRRFAQECKVLVQLHHKNIVGVVGWCDHRRLRALVTEWTDEEHVEMWMAGSAPPWKQRLKVLMGVLEAMRYLQGQWPQVGYDLRTCSILLSKNRQPLISRFKIEGDPTSNTKKIYKFGMLVLEMITNKRPREEFDGGEAEFVEWIRMNYPGNLHKVIDERMKKTGNTVDQTTQGIGIGLMCAYPSRGRPPSFDSIYRIMSKLSDSYHVPASPDYKRSHGDKSLGHRRNQSR